MEKRIYQAVALIAAFALMFTYIDNMEETVEYSPYGATAGVSNLKVANIQEVETVSASYSEEQQDALSEASAQNYGYTNLGVANCEGNLNVRETPETSGKIVGKMPEHAACEIIEFEGDWVHIKSGNVEGYVSAEFLATGDEAKTLADENASLIGKVNTTSLRLRKEPNTDSGIITLIPEGEEIEVLEDMGDWVHVNVDNDDGYVSAEYIDESVSLPHAMTLKELDVASGVSGTRASLVNYALQFVGNPYVWGGTSLTKGADCSGFVMSIYARYGISLPHSSKAQANYGTRIKASEAQPGDLFFYGSGKSISHVAIYIGNGMIVHASNKKTGIKTSSAYYRTPICVTRLLN